MKMYIALAVLTLYSGMVMLTGAQAKRRRFQVEPVKVDKETGDGVYRIKDGAQVQFKPKEEFGCDGSIPKSWYTMIEPLEGKLPERKPTPVTAAKTGSTLRGRVGKALNKR